MKALVNVLVLMCTLNVSLACALATDTIEQPHIKVRLLSANSVIAVDDVNYLGLELVPQDGWHVYWRNPGDSGMPPRIRFELEGGVQIEKPHWPVPHKIPFGPLTNYGYEKVVLPIPFTLKTKSAPPLRLIAKSSWLVCKELCVPGTAQFVLDIPIADKGIESPEAIHIKQALARVPKALPILGGSAELDEMGRVDIRLYTQKTIFQTAKSVEFFPINEQLIDAGSRADIRWKQNLLTIKQQKSNDYVSMPEKIAGVLIVNGNSFWSFEFKP